MKNIKDEVYWKVHRKVDSKVYREVLWEVCREVDSEVWIEVRDKVEERTRL